jgi:hypothetical protein
MQHQCCNRFSVTAAVKWSCCCNLSDAKLPQLQSSFKVIESSNRLSTGSCSRRLSDYKLPQLQSSFSNRLSRGSCCRRLSDEKLQQLLLICQSCSQRSCCNRLSTPHATPHAFLIFLHSNAVLHMIFTFWSCSKNFLGMRCQWHRMHQASSVNDNACTVHAVSLTPHACVHPVSMTPHGF